MTSIAQIRPYQADIVVNDNEDWNDFFLFTLPDLVTPLDVSGVQFTIEVRPSSESPVVLFSGTTDDGTMVLLPTTASAGALCALTMDVLAPGFPRSLAPGVYVYQIRAYAESQTTDAFTGSLTVKRGIVR